MLRPLNDVVIVEMDEDRPLDSNPEVERIIKSGLIVVPDKTSLIKVADTGIVISKGPKCTGDYKVGERVKYQSFGGITVNHEGKRLRMLREQELNAVIE